MNHVIFLIALFFSLPCFNNKKYPLFIFSFFLLFLFLALRYDYGNDYMSYYYIHMSINEGLKAWGENDILFKYLNILIPNFYLLISITSLFYISTIYFLIRNTLEIKKYWFAILLLLINPYLFLMQLSSIRQTIAACFIVFSFYFATKRKYLYYIFFVLIATGFHKSAIVLLPVYFLLNESRVNRKTYVLIYVFLGFLLGTSLLETILNEALYYFPSYLSFIEQGLHNSLRSLLISSFFFFLVTFNINKLQGKEIIYGKIALIATIISLLTFKLSMISRIGMYFNIYLIIAIPLIFSRLKFKANAQILFVIMITIYLLRYVSFFSNPLWIPYYSTYRTIFGIY